MSVHDHDPQDLDTANHDRPGRAFHLLASGPVLVRLLRSLGGPLLFLAVVLLIRLYQVLAHSR